MAQVRRSASSTAQFSLACRWTLRRLGRLDHERRVHAIAGTLFDLTQPLHHLSSAEKQLLELGAIMHDVGRKVDDKHHPAIGAKMILEDTSLPMNESVRRCVAYLTRYHRGAVPEVGFDEILQSSDSRRRMRLVLALLRAADALDGRQLEAPAIVLAMKGRKLSVTVYLEDDTPKARRFFKRRKKFRLLEEQLGCKVEVDIRDADVVQHVA